MLRTYGGNDAGARTNEVADFLDVAFLLGAHLDDENLVVGFQQLIDGAHDTKCGVVAAGGHEGAVLLAEDALQIVFGAGLAVTAGYADNLQSGHRTQRLLRPVVKLTVDMLFDGLQQPVCQLGELCRKAEDKKHCYRDFLVSVAPAVACQSDYKAHDDQQQPLCQRYAPGATRKGKRFLILTAGEVEDVYYRYGGYQPHRYKGNAECRQRGHRHCRRDKAHDGRAVAGL